MARESESKEFLQSIKAESKPLEQQQTTGRQTGSSQKNFEWERRQGDRF